MAVWGSLSSSEASARMMPLVEQALSIDGDLAEAWQYLAYVRQANGDLEDARAAEKKALELDPQNPLVLRSQILRWMWTHEPERALVYADELLRVDPLSPEALLTIGALYNRLGRFDDQERMLKRILSIDPQNNAYFWGSANLAISRGNLVTALGLLEEATKIDPDDPEGPSWIARAYFDLGDVAAAEFWTDAALRLDPEAPWVRLMAALLHLYHGEEAEAVATARELARPGSDNRFATRGIALRMVAVPDLAAGNYEEIIARYLTHYPELAGGTFLNEQLPVNWFIWEAFLVTLDLASAYLHSGEKAKAESLLSQVESELPHWPKGGGGVWGYGIADVELHALRGEKEQALAALREHAAAGTRYMWRWQVLYNPNLDSIRETPEFAAIVSEIEADMAAQLARVREMERNGELEPIPEVSATTQ
jgi:tetratricopeptide (TPR) repeat protein